MTKLRRHTQEPGEVPYYFSWTLILNTGERIPQYDERGRLVKWSELPIDVINAITKIEAYPHPVFVARAPSTEVVVADDTKLDLYYEGSQQVDQPTYIKKALVITSDEKTVTLRPDDFYDQTQPTDLYTVSIE